MHYHNFRKSFVSKLFRWIRQSLNGKTNQEILERSKEYDVHATIEILSEEECLSFCFLKLSL